MPFAHVPEQVRSGQLTQTRTGLLEGTELVKWKQMMDEKRRDNEAIGSFPLRHRIARPGLLVT